MEGHCSTGQSPHWVVVPMEQEEEEEEEEEEGEKMVLMWPITKFIDQTPYCETISCASFITSVYWRLF